VCLPFRYLGYCAAGDRISPGFPWYKRNLLQNRNYGRWIEYFFSSSIMIVLISQITGISDIAALMAIFGVNASMILFGALQEKYEKPGKPNLLPFWMGSFAGIIPWIAILIYVIAPGLKVSPPGFVYGIIASLFVFFNCFAVNMILQYKKSAHGGITCSEKRSTSSSVSPPKLYWPGRFLPCAHPKIAQIAEKQEAIWKGG